MERGPSRSTGLAAPCTRIPWIRIWAATPLHDESDGDHSLATAVSVDGGLTWTDAKIVTPGNSADADILTDYLAVGPDAEDLNKDLFVLVWSERGIIYFSTSSAGTTWSDPVRISNLTGGHGDPISPPSGAAIDPVVTIGPNGEIYVAWEDFTSRLTPTVDVDVSLDRGVTWGFGFEKTLHYDTNVSDLTQEQKDVLDGLAAELIADHLLYVTIEGYTDRVGTTTNNQTLSDARAQKVYDYLAGVPGVDSSVLHQVSFGETELAVATLDGVDEPLNRRVRITLDRVVYLSDVNPFSPGPYLIPAQPNRGIRMGLSIDVDRSGGEHNGRIYLALADQGDLNANTNDHPADLDIFVIASEDGKTWHALDDSPNVVGNHQVKVNDDGGFASQFFPWLGVDQKTGYVAVGWYDARNDVDNEDVEYFAAYSKDGGETWSDNIKVSDGASNGGCAPAGNLGLVTGLEFDNGTIHLAWADNSNSTGDNPDGTRHSTDIYYDRISLVTTYLGIQADLDDAHLIGVPGFEIWASGTVKMNKARDLDGNPSPVRMNWKEATTTHDPGNQLADLDITSEVTLQVKGSAAINIAGVLLAYTGDVQITFAETTVDDGEIELENASVISIEVDGAQVFVGKDGALKNDHTGLDVTPSAKRRLASSSMTRTSSSLP